MFEKKIDKSGDVVQLYTDILANETVDTDVHMSDCVHVKCHQRYNTGFQNIWMLPMSGTSSSREENCV